MAQRKRIIRLWALLGLVVAVLLGVLAKPMIIGWRCYQLNASGEHATSAVVKKLASPTLVLQIESGSAEGSACTARTSAAHHDAIQIGQMLDIVHRPDIPGECVLNATLENSAALLWAISGGIAVIVLMLVWVGIVAQRSFAATAFLTSHLDADPKDVTCPQCGVEMAEGYLPLLAGIHWRELEEPVGLPHALGGLPGTTGWRSRPRLHAFRCEACSVVTFKYGEPAKAS